MILMTPLSLKEIVRLTLSPKEDLIKRLGESTYEIQVLRSQEMDLHIYHKLQILEEECQIISQIIELKKEHEILV